MSLATLYGAPDAHERLLAEFEKAGPGCQLIEEDDPNEAPVVYVTITWAGGNTLKLAFTADRLHYRTIDIHTGGPRFYEQLLDTDVPAICKGWGIKCFTAAARDAEAKRFLKRPAHAGFHERGAPGPYPPDMPEGPPGVLQLEWWL